MGIFDDEPRHGPGRIIQESGRVGVHKGRAARTYHVHFNSVRVGDVKAGPKGAVDYLARDGDFEKKSADLEHVAGDREAVIQGAAAVEAAAKVRKGPTAEKVLVKQTFELPRELDQRARADVAERIVAAWDKKGHLAVAAVHGNGQVQPHIHVAVTARPFTPDGRVDRDPAKVALRGGKAAVRAERRKIADLVNTVLDERQIQAPRFYGGRDREMDEAGIQGRDPKRRVPQRAWHVRRQQERDPRQVAEIHARAKQQRQARAEQAKDRKAEQARKRAARADRQGFAPKTEVAKARREPRPLTEAQRQIFADRGIALPADIDTNAAAQSAAFKQLRPAIKQAEKRAEAKGAERGAAFADGLAALDRAAAAKTRTRHPKRPGPTRGGFER